MRYFLIVVTIFLSLSAFGMNSHRGDSIGIERVGNSTFILHRVEAKETLYSLSRRYEVDVKSILTSNPAAEHGLDIGQIVRIPIKKSRAPVRPEGIVHVVRAGETLYSIASRYEVETDEIRKWNHISTSILDIGQELHIYPSLSRTKNESPSIQISDDHRIHTVSEGETLYSISRNLEVPMDSLRRWNNLKTNDISIGDQLIIGFKKKEEKKDVTRIEEQPVASAKPEPEIEIQETSKPVEIPVSVQNDDLDDDVVVVADPATMVTDEIFESGLAEAIEGSGNNRKYLGLHRTVPVGTVMRVRNEMNGQEVFVRIIGKLPDTGANRNIVIKISKSAYDGLGAIDSRFRVTVSYLP